MIRSQDQVGKLPLCCLFSWREDLSMYHETEFVQKETVSGAACSTVVNSDRDDSDKDDNDDIVISGSTVELKVSSREAHKVQLALTVDTEVGKLEMDFLSNVSTLTWCRESVGFNECLLKVKNILEN